MPWLFYLPLVEPGVLLSLKATKRGNRSNFWNFPGRDTGRLSHSAGQHQSGIGSHSTKSRGSLSKLQVIPPKFQEYTARHPECNCNHFFFTDMGDHIFLVRCIMEDFIEDAATGSANGHLAGYLLSYGYFGSSPISYTIHQGEDMGRKSVLHILANRESDDWLIEVSGTCHIVAEGDWR